MIYESRLGVKAIDWMILDYALLGSLGTLGGKEAGGRERI